MSRILFALALALVFGQATGMASALAGGECSERCPGDAPDGTCPPNCQFCACGSLPRMLTPKTVALMPAPVTHRIARASQDVIPNSPEPAEILHIPKASRVSAI